MTYPVVLEPTAEVPELSTSRDLSSICMWLFPDVNSTVSSSSSSVSVRSTTS